MQAASFRTTRNHHNYKGNAVFEKDKPAEVDRAEQSLQTTKNELEHAGKEGGHRVQTIRHVDAVLQELEKAEQWARQHREIKWGCNQPY